MIAKPERYYGNYYNDCMVLAVIFKSAATGVLHLSAHLGLAGPLMCVKSDTLVCTLARRYFGKSTRLFSLDSSGTGNGIQHQGEGGLCGPVGVQV